MDNANLTHFSPRILDKVERLLDLLDELATHPLLRGKLALHGGTAINLFMLDIPRLSVDIDLSYVGSVGREEMLADRPVVERSIIEVANSQDYTVLGAQGGHAGRTFVLNYRSQWGVDHVKVDCIYLSRSPLMQIQAKVSPMRPDLRVPVFADAELVGGKAKAFFDRVKVRDLYDLANLKRVIDDWPEHGRIQAHRIILFYASLSAAFPRGFDDRPDRFIDKAVELEGELSPMLRRGAIAPSLDELIATARGFISAYVLPRTEREQEYLDRFARGDFEPWLLFGGGPVARAALASPEAQWKLQNLEKMR